MNVMAYLEIEIHKFCYVQIIFQLKFIFGNCIFKKSYIIFTQKIIVFIKLLKHLHVHQFISCKSRKSFVVFI